MPNCAIKLCTESTSTSIYTKDGISFHRFPSNSETRKVWIEATHRENYFPENMSVICSRHFTPDCFENHFLKISAVPTLHLPSLVPPTSSLRVCRGCLATDVRLYDMRQNQLLEAYNRLLHVTDDLPHYLCSYCAVLLLKCDTFRIKCIDTLLTLRNAQLDNEHLTKQHIERIDRQTNKLTLFTLATTQCLLITNIDPIDTKDNDSIRSDIVIKEENDLNSDPNMDIKISNHITNDFIKYEEENGIYNEPEVSLNDHNDPLIGDKTIIKDYLDNGCTKDFDNDTIDTSCDNSPDWTLQKPCLKIINKKNKMTNKKQFKPRRNNLPLKVLKLFKAHKESNSMTQIVKDQNNEAAKESDIIRETNSEPEVSLTDNDDPLIDDATLLKDYLDNDCTKNFDNHTIDTSGDNSPDWTIEKPCLKAINKTNKITIKKQFKPRRNKLPLKDLKLLKAHKGSNSMTQIVKDQNNEAAKESDIIRETNSEPEVSLTDHDDPLIDEATLLKDYLDYDWTKDFDFDNDTIGTSGDNSPDWTIEKPCLKAINKTNKITIKKQFKPRRNKLPLKDIKLLKTNKKPNSKTNIAKDQNYEAAKESDLNRETYSEPEVSLTDNDDPLIDDATLLKAYLDNDCTKNFDNNTIETCGDNSPDWTIEKPCLKAINKTNKITIKKQFKPRRNKSPLKDLKLLKTNKKPNSKTNIVKDQIYEAAKESDLSRGTNSELEVSLTDNDDPLIDDATLLKDYLDNDWTKDFDNDTIDTSCDNSPDWTPKKPCLKVINKKNKITNKKQFKPRRNKLPLKDLKLLKAHKETNSKTKIVKDQNNEGAEESDLEIETNSDNDNDVTNNDKPKLKKNHYDKFCKECNMDVKMLATKKEQIHYHEEILNIRKESVNYSLGEFKCDVCIKGFVLEKLYDKHMKHLHSERRGSVKCDICKIHFSSRTVYQRHKIIHTQIYSCKKCDFSTNTISKARDHHNSHIGVKYTCKHCEREFAHRSSYYGHLKLFHPTSDGFIRCEMCGDSLFGAVGIYRHERVAHKEMYSPECLCSGCDTQFYCSDAFKAHQGTDGLCDTLHKYCVRCGMSFETEELLKEHEIEQRKPPKEFECEVCMKKFLNFTYFNRHISRNHNPDNNKTDKRNCVCEICGTTHKNRELLALHKRKTHPGYRPHVDPKCPKKFKKLEKLKTHATERPYICDICGKSFSEKNYVAVHIKNVHMKIRMPTRIGNKNKKYL